MTALKTKLLAKIEEARPRTTRLVKEFGKVVIDEVTIDQCIGGARDIKALVTDISYLDPQEGIRFRGKTIPETFEALPKAPGSAYPTVESFWWFLLTGEVPTQAEVDGVLADWKVRQAVPDYVWAAIRALPRDSHPMVMLSVALLALEKDSKFKAYYNSGKFNKNAAWEYVYEDASDIVARIPIIAAFIYNLKYRGDKQGVIDPTADAGANYARMIGQSKEYEDVARMYFILHSDHESGNVSAHTTHLVHSALSDPYYAYSAGLNGLAGPLHGLANQEVIKWIYEMREEIGVEIPTKQQIEEYVKKTLNEGKVVPGYGHAVLRKTDPRFTAQMEFGKKHMPDDPLVQTVWNIYEAVPPVLGSIAKIKNPWPNVDAHSGALLVHYGFVEYEFYTVLFGVSRALGVLASLCWDRALGFPLERPKSVTTNLVKDWLAGKEEIWEG